MVARLVGPSELGLGAAVVAVHVVLWVAVNALFADALVQRGDADAETLATALWASVAAGCLAVPLQIAGGWLLAAWLHDPRLLRDEPAARGAAAAGRRRRARCRAC